MLHLIPYFGLTTCCPCSILFVNRRVRLLSFRLPTAFVLGFCGYSAPAEMSLHSPAHVANNRVASVYSVADLPSSLCLDFTVDPPHMHASADAGIPNAG